MSDRNPSGYQGYGYQESIHLAERAKDWDEKNRKEKK